MPLFRVTVVSSYAPIEPTGGPLDTSHLFDTDATLTQALGVKRCLQDWVSRRDGRRLTESHEIDPPRLTLEVDYNDIDAPSEWDARTDGLALFREDAGADSLPEAESVVATAEEQP